MHVKSFSINFRNALRISSSALLAAFGWCCSAEVLAQNIDTFERIRTSNVIKIGNREAARPFSFLSEQKEAKGYSVDLCLQVVERLRKELKLPGLKAEFVTVTAAERIPKLLDGSIDMECGSTTNTKSRQEKVAFSYTIFVAGMKLLSRSEDNISGLGSLNGKIVALSKGTTSEKLFNELHNSEMRDMRVVQYANNSEALKALVDGKVKAFPQDDILLEGLISKLPDKNKYAFSEGYLSVEPYAIMVRRQDTRLLAQIDGTLTDLYSSGKINTIYRQWFENEAINVPISRLTQEAFKHPARDTAFVKMLGYSL